MNFICYQFEGENDIWMTPPENLPVIVLRGETQGPDGDGDYTTTIWMKRVVPYGAEATMTFYRGKGSIGSIGTYYVSPEAGGGKPCCDAGATAYPGPCPWHSVMNTKTT